MVNKIIILLGIPFIMGSLFWSFFTLIHIILKGSIIYVEPNIFMSIFELCMLSYSSIILVYLINKVVRDKIL